LDAYPAAWRPAAQSKRAGSPRQTPVVPVPPLGCSFLVRQFAWLIDCPPCSAGHFDFEVDINKADLAISPYYI